MNVDFRTTRDENGTDGGRSPPYATFGKSRSEIEAILAKNSGYSPMFRFTLIDEDERVFGAERWCFRGSIDDWIDLAGVASLKAIAELFLPYLGDEGFYELM